MSTSLTPSGAATPRRRAGLPGRTSGLGLVEPAGPAGRGAAMRRRRRPGLWGAGAALVAVGALATAGLVGRAGDRTEVLAVARTVPVGQQLTAADVTVARLPADPALHPIPAAELDRVVSRVAAVELTAGSLLTPSQVTDAAVPGAGQQLVGVAAKPGQLPARGVRPGDRVLAVPVPGDQAGTTATDAAGGSTTGGGSAAGAGVAARVVQVGPPGPDGAVTVDLLVGQDIGPQLAGLASTGRLALVLLPAGGDR